MMFLLVKQPVKKGGNWVEIFKILLNRGYTKTGTMFFYCPWTMNYIAERFGQFLISYVSLETLEYVSTLNAYLSKIYSRLFSWRKTFMD